MKDPCTPACLIEPLESRIAPATLSVLAPGHSPSFDEQDAFVTDGVGGRVIRIDDVSVGETDSQRTKLQFIFRSS